MSEHAAEKDALTQSLFLTGKQVGVNLDPIHVPTGLATLEALGWDRVKDARTFMVIEYALQRWGRGEEAEAERLAIAQGETDPEFRAAAIDLTSWRMVLASAMAAGDSLDRPIPPGNSGGAA